MDNSKNYEVHFNVDLLLDLVRRNLEDCDAQDTEFGEFVNILIEYKNLMDEYISNSAKMAKRLKKDYNLSDKLYKMMSDPTAPKNKLDAKTVMEIFQFNQMFRNGIIRRTELLDTFKKANRLKKRVKKVEVFLPEVASQCDVELEYLDFFVKKILNQLELMANQL